MDSTKEQCPGVGTEALQSNSSADFKLASSIADGDRSNPESQVLGAMIMEPRNIAEVRAIVTGADFHDPRNEMFFDAILAADDDPNILVDPNTVADKITDAKVFDRAGGVARLHELVAGCVAFGNAGYYAEQVVKAARVRAVGAAWADYQDTHNPERLRAALDALDAGVAANTTEARAERAMRMFPRLDWNELWEDDDEDEWIHYPLLPARRLVTIYSPPKVGKSLLMLEMAVAISRGETFLDFTPDRSFRVLYVDFENDPRGDIRSRLQAMGYAPADLDRLDYLSFPTMAGFDTERGALDLIEAVKAYRSEVVIVDTVSRAVDGEENSNDTWLGLYRQTGLRLKQLGVAMARLDHSGKDETRGTRGGSAKSGDVDAIWKLSRVSEHRFKLECTDSRMQIDSKVLHLTRNSTPRLHHTLDGRSAQQQHEARLREMVALCDANELPEDAPRKDVAEFLRGRGIKARSEVFAEVVRRRKLSPTLGDNDDSGTVPDAGGQPGQDTDATPDIPQNDATSDCPDLFGDSRGQHASASVPVSVPHVVGTDGRGTGLDTDCGHCRGDLSNAGPRRFNPGFRCFHCDRLADGSEVTP